MLDPGTRVYDVNTKQTGTLKTAPYISDSGARQVADVRWDNGELSVVFTDHIRAYRQTYCVTCEACEATATEPAFEHEHLMVTA